MNKELLRKVIDATFRSNGGKATLTAGGGAALGGLWGQLVSPELGDYKDNKTARWISMLAGMAAGGFGGTAIRQGIRNGMTPGVRKEIGTAIGALTTGEVLPVGLKALQSGTGAANNFSDAAAGLSDAIDKPTVTDQLKTILNSDAGKGALMGTAAAGLGSVVSGLTRKETNTEFHNRSSRSDMVGSDFKKYLLPALVAGAVGGHYLGKPQVS